MASFAQAPELPSNHYSYANRQAGTPLNLTARAQVRTELAFWAAADKRAVIEGPGWLWTGQILAPLRPSELPTPVADKLRARGRAGLPVSSALPAGDGPRHFRLPRRLRRAGTSTRWGIAAGGIGAAALLVAPTLAGSGDIVTVTGAAALTAACTLGAIQIWDRTDPLRLTRAERQLIDQSRRSLNWRPLAGKGRIGTPAAILILGTRYVRAITASPSWSAPQLQTLRWRFDPDEELFQLATSTHRLLELEHEPTDSDEAERIELHRVLIDRLAVLATCRDALAHMQTQTLTYTELPDTDAFVAAAHNELALVDLTDLAEGLIAAASSTGTWPPAAADNPASRAT
ncbi:Uncharacterised protein [Mycobacteroides abscessus subsp. abscessus]|uniref:hypothetical protein n=1 Tax=Mycobacteroides abscessus TaxID=36809 RepID=UPI000926152F|nr:hypothetical protein [Mycobacteroides abscessus]SHU71897.1 Uncharacterised protein [Mycobacteroides abscessus subsp. abscessus]